MTSLGGRSKGRSGRVALAATLLAASVTGCSLLALDGASEGGEPASPDAAVTATTDGGAGDEASTPASGGDAAAAPLGTYEQEVLTDKPLALWHFDEAQGPLAADAVKNFYPGNFVDGQGKILFRQPGALPAPNTWGIGVGNGYISMGNVDPFEFPGRAPFSIEVWVNPARGPIVSKTYDAQGYQLRIDDNGLVFWRAVASPRSDGVVARPVGLVAGRFSYVVATYDGTEMRLYVDAALAAPPTKHEATLVKTGAQFRVGNDSYGSTNFNGVVDELAIYDVALTPEQIARHYKAAGR